MTLPARVVVGMLAAWTALALVAVACLGGAS